MSNDPITVKSSLLQTQLKTTWGNLSEQDFRNYEGRREHFFSSLKDKYGLSQEDAEKQITGFDKPEIDGKDHSAVSISKA